MFLAKTNKKAENPSSEGHGETELRVAEYETARMGDRAIRSVRADVWNVGAGWFGWSSKQVIGDGIMR